MMETDRNTGEDHQSQPVLQKGNCNECSFYFNCPRMKGIGRCHNVSKPQNHDPTEKPTGNKAVA